MFFFQLFKGICSSDLKRIHHKMQQKGGDENVTVGKQISLQLQRSFFVAFHSNYYVNHLTDCKEVVSMILNSVDYLVKLAYVWLIA